MIVSIVVPAYNAEEYLPETVESILSQTVSEWELIIVNDGSQDATRTLAEQFAARDARIRVVHQANTGLPGARNRGYEESSPQARFIIFLDADDLWEPNTLAVLIAALEGHPEAVAAHGLARYIDDRGRLIRPGKLEARIHNRKAIVNGRFVSWPLEKPTTFAVLAVDCYIVSAGSVLIRRSALEKVGLFDRMRHLPRASLEDWDLWLRLCLHGDFAVVPQVVLNYRQHGANLSKATHLMYQGHVYVRMKTLLSPELLPEQRRLMQISNQQAVATDERRLAYYEWRMARESLRPEKANQATALLRAGWQHYGRYLRLRHSIAVTEAWVRMLLESSAPAPSGSETCDRKQAEEKREHSHN
jgi:glycosyltransferase involved in cell wall biosynthesis